MKFKILLTFVISLAFSLFAQGSAANEVNVGCVVVMKTNDENPLTIFSKVMKASECDKYRRYVSLDKKDEEDKDRYLNRLSQYDYETGNDDRLILEKNQKVMVHVIGEPLCGAKIQFNEKKRKSTIEKDGDVLVKILSKLLLTESGCDLTSSATHVLKNKRSELEIVITKPAALAARTKANDQASSKPTAPSEAPGKTVTKDKPEAAQDVADKEADDSIDSVGNDSVANDITTKRATEKGSEKDEIKYSIATGPTENYFLSADMVVTSIDELKYDPETNTLSEKNKPTKYYLGLNYMLGDVLTDYDSLAYQRFFIKAMFQLDRHPTDSYGIGIGYRPKFIESVSIYAAYMYSKEDKLEDGKLKENMGKNEEAVFGISFNLDKALGWLSK